MSEGYLPAERAEFCYEEYEKVQYAFELLIQPHIDKELAEQTYGRPWLCDRQDDSASVKYKDCLLAPPE